MPKLIKNIVVDYQETLLDSIPLSNNILVEFQDGDYQKVGGHIAFLQDYSQFGVTEDLKTTTDFGLRVNKNKTFTELKISY